MPVAKEFLMLMKVSVNVEVPQDYSVYIIFPGYLMQTCKVFVCKRKGEGGKEKKKPKQDFKSGDKLETGHSWGTSAYYAFIF